MITKYKVLSFLGVLGVSISLWSGVAHATANYDVTTSGDLLNTKSVIFTDKKDDKSEHEQDSSSIAEHNFVNSFIDKGTPHIALEKCLDKHNNSPAICSITSFIKPNGELDLFGITALADNNMIRAAWIDMSNKNLYSLYVINNKGYVYHTVYSYIYASAVSEILAKNNIHYSIVSDWSIRASGFLDILSKIIMNIFPILIIYILWKQLSMFKKSGSSKIKSSDTLTFKDIAGNNEIKKELESYIRDLKSTLAKKEVSWKGSKIDLPRGVIFEGPPGNGKTMFASAVAGECGLPFYEISGSNVVELYVGLAAKKIRNIFAEARKQKKGAIIFIDEIDAFAGKRSNGGSVGNSEQEQALNELLVQMDGVRYKKKNDKIIIMAATNRIDMLDPALLRSGRFDRKIMIPNPDYMTRIALFKLYSKDMPLDASVTAPRVASLTDGMCSADMKNLMNQSLIRARDLGQDLVDISCVDDAFDKIVMGHERSTENFLEEEHKLTVYHEAGHALACILLPHTDRVRKITSIPRGGALGMVSMLPDEKSQLRSKSKMLSQIKVCLAGRAVEEIVFGDDLVTTGASSDISQATYIAKLLIGRLGMSKEIGMVEVIDDHGNYKGSPETMTKVDELVRNLIQSSYVDVKKLLEENRDCLDAIYKALDEKQTLTGEEAVNIVKQTSEKRHQI